LFLEPQVPEEIFTNSQDEDEAALEELQEQERQRASRACASTAPPCPVAAAVGTQADPFSRLASLVQWRSQGFLSEEEFIKAKQLLGLN